MGLKPPKMSADRPPERVPGPSPELPPEQAQYASVLTWGVRAGMLLVAVAFAAYVGGWLPSAVPPAELPRWWGLPLGAFVQQTNATTGWGWLSRLGQGDATALLGVAVLTSAALPALLVLAVQCWRRQDRALALLAALQVMVVLLAASGWLSGAH